MPLWLYFLVAAVSFGGTFLALVEIIPLLARAGIVGKDLHKPDKPEIPEMGGLGTLVGISGGLVLVIGAEAFLGIGTDVRTLLAVLSTVLIVAFIGVFDDLLDIRQIYKSISPVFAALPLMAIRAGATTLSFPLFGKLDFWIFYPLFLIPLGVTGAANAVNMLAGFNGMEVGIGIVALGSLAVIAGFTESVVALCILVIGLAALLPALYFNWYPARIMVGDVGTLTIGAIMASAVIVGNFETAGVIIIIPHFIDFLFKAASGFPSSGWKGELGNDGKLYCEGAAVSLPQFIMKITGGISERNLTLVVMGLEAVAGLFAVGVYLF